MATQGSLGTLVAARQITPEIHTAILDALRRALALLQAGTPQEPGVRELRVRDWWIVVDEGEPCLEIFLDKGYVAAPQSPGGLEASTRLTLEECAEFHAFLLETDVLDVFGDSLQIRVGSPGGEPFLRDVTDYQASIGLMVDVRTWTKIENRDKFVMLLQEVIADSAAPPTGTTGAAIVLQEGPHTFRVPLGNVRFAQAMPFHPSSRAGSKKGKGPRRK